MSAIFYFLFLCCVTRLKVQQFIQYKWIMCCVFRPANGCFTCRSQVESVFLLVLWKHLKNSTCFWVVCLCFFYLDPYKMILSWCHDVCTIFFVEGEILIVFYQLKRKDNFTLFLLSLFLSICLSFFCSNWHFCFNT